MFFDIVKKKIAGNSVYCLENFILLSVGRNIIIIKLLQTHSSDCVFGAFNIFL